MQRKQIAQKRFRICLTFLTTLSTIYFVSLRKLDDALNGPLVKRLRHRPFTAITGVRVPYGSPLYFLNGPVVQLVRMPACHAGGRRFEPVPGRHFKIMNADINQQRKVLLEKSLRTFCLLSCRY